MIFFSVEPLDSGSMCNVLLCSQEDLLSQIRLSSQESRESCVSLIFPDKCLAKTGGNNVCGDIVLRCQSDSHFQKKKKNGRQETSKQSNGSQRYPLTQPIL